MRVKIILCLIIFPTISYSQFNRKEKKELETIIEQVSIKLEYLLSDNWYVVPHENGFDVNFCPTCMSKFKRWLDKHSTKKGLSRAELFEKFGPDSVFNYSGVSIVRNENSGYLLRTYNDIVQYKIWFERKWDSSKIQLIQTQNDSLVQAIYSGPVYKTDKRQFEDFRYFVPKNYWKDRTEHLNFKFERLPYHSYFYDYSVFIDLGQRSWSSRPTWYDRNDTTSVQTQIIKYDQEFLETPVLVALVLGIKDFFAGRKKLYHHFHKEIKSDIELR